MTHQDQSLIRNMIVICWFRGVVLLPGGVRAFCYHLGLSYYHLVSGYTVITWWCPGVLLLPGVSGCPVITWQCPGVWRYPSVLLLPGGVRASCYHLGVSGYPVITWWCPCILLLPGGVRVSCWIGGSAAVRPNRLLRVSTDSSSG